MESWKYLSIGIIVGLVIALFTYVYMAIKRDKLIKKNKIEIEKYRKMLSDRMELESEGLSKLKKENESLAEALNKEREENTLLKTKPGRKEALRLELYQKALDRLTVVSPGFAQAWLNTINEIEKENKKSPLPFLKSNLIKKEEYKEIEDNS